MLVSVITVTFNCKDSIEETINSVLNQTYRDIEYLIIDGTSTDGTLEVINKYAQEDSRIKYISEKDNGIYDAMNKGINLVSGNVVYLLNSGDVLYDKYVILNVIKSFQKYNSDIIFGDVVIFDRFNKEAFFVSNREFINIKSLTYSKMICHQAIFAKTSVFKKIGMFDLKYKISADYDWAIRCYKNKVEFKYINIVIANYDNSGISSLEENRDVRYKEYKNIIIKQLGITHYIYLKLRIPYRIIFNYYRKHLNNN